MHEELESLKSQIAELKQQTESIQSEAATGIFYGVGFAAAFTVSLTKSASLWWALFHGIFSWLYVLLKLFLP